MDMQGSWGRKMNGDVPFTVADRRIGILLKAQVASCPRRERNPDIHHNNKIVKARMDKVVKKKDSAEL